MLTWVWEKRATRERGRFKFASPLRERHQQELTFIAVYWRTRRREKRYKSFHRKTSFDQRLYPIKHNIFRAWDVKLQETCPSKFHCSQTYLITIGNVIFFHSQTDCTKSVDYYFFFFHKRGICISRAQLLYCSPKKTNRLVKLQAVKKNPWKHEKTAAILTSRLHMSSTSDNKTKESDWRFLTFWEVIKGTQLWETFEH